MTEHGWDGSKSYIIICVLGWLVQHAVKKVLPIAVGHCPSPLAIITPPIRNQRTTYLRHASRLNLLFLRFLPVVAIAEVKTVLPQAHAHGEDHAESHSAGGSAAAPASRHDA